MEHFGLHHAIRHPRINPTCDFGEVCSLHLENILYFQKNIYTIIKATGYPPQRKKVLYIYIYMKVYIERLHQGGVSIFSAHRKNYASQDLHIHRDARGRSYLSFKKNHRSLALLSFEI